MGTGHDIILWIVGNAATLVPAATIVAVSLSMGYALWLVMPNLLGVIAALIMTTGATVVVLHYQGDLDQMRQRMATRSPPVAPTIRSGIKTDLPTDMARVSPVMIVADGTMDGDDVSFHEPHGSTSAVPTDAARPATVESGSAPTMAPGLQRIFDASR